MPALVRLAGQHRDSLEALVRIAGYERVQQAIAETRDTGPPVTVPARLVSIGHDSCDYALIDRLMRQRAAGPLGSAV